MQTVLGLLVPGRAHKPCRLKLELTYFKVCVIASSIDASAKACMPSAPGLLVLPCNGFMPCAAISIHAWHASTPHSALGQCGGECCSPCTSWLPPADHEEARCGAGGCS